MSTKQRLRIYDVSVTSQAGGEHQCAANVVVSEVGPFKFSLLIPVSCHDPIISSFRQTGMIQEPTPGETGLLSGTDLQSVLSDIFCAAIGLYVDNQTHEMRQPREIRLTTLDPREVSALVTRCYRRKLVQKAGGR